jgi:DNA-binding beta-propeller fold protein YncE
MIKSNTMRCVAACTISSLLFGAPPVQAADLLTPKPPLKLTGTKGKFDFIAIDAERRRLLAAHTGNGTLDIIDLDKSELIKSIPTGAAQDCAVDTKGKRYLVSVSKPPQLAIVDAEKLVVTGTVPLKGPADLLAIHPVSGHAYVDHDDGKQVWVIAPGEQKLVATVELPTDSPEDLAFDASGERLFQAMKTASTMTVIDVATNKVTATWPTAPATAPHGIALIPEAGAIAIAGGNAKVVLMSQKDGKILASDEIPMRVDQIAYDGEWHRLYCASALGKLAIFAIEDGHLKKLGEVNSAEGARSVAVDPKTHTVWVAYAKGEESFVQGFAAQK